MRILITNDDSINAKGIKVLEKILKPFGEVIVVAPKYVQSGMAMAVNLKREPVGLRYLGEEDGVKRYYFNGTPSACVKIAVNYLCLEPDVVVSGINHGINACAALLYSGTLGAAAEAAINGIPAIGVSLNDFHADADFSGVEKFFPEIFEKIVSNYRIYEDASPCNRTHGIYYNVNFPKCSPEEIKGVRVATQGSGRWIKEWTKYNPEIHYAPQYQAALDALEEGEEIVVIGGEYEDDQFNGPLADHHFVFNNYVAVTPHKLDCTDYEEVERIQNLF